MANLLREDKSTVYVGLGTFTADVKNTGMYTVSVRTTDNPVSDLVIVIQQEGNLIATSLDQSASQPGVNHLELSAVLNCVAGDTIDVILSSGVAIDNQLNTIKSVIVLKQGL